MCKIGGVGGVCEVCGVVGEGIGRGVAVCHLAGVGWRWCLSFRRWCRWRWSEERGMCEEDIRNNFEGDDL